jgi:peptidoglycan/LPS O-acetylase OafA/YrhL
MADARWPALDGVRGIAVLLVVAYHLGLPHSSRGGAIGVTMFFSLSGFLITSLLLREADQRGSIDLPSFSMRRVLRLVPALTVLCAGVLVWTIASDPVDRTRAAVPWVVLYAGNWERVIHGMGSLGALEHAWSLGVEEQFYLLWPLCVLGLGVIARPASRAAGVLVGSLIGAVLSLAWRVHLWNPDDPFHSVGRLYNGTDAVADQLLLGCALAAALHLLRGRAGGRVGVRRAAGAVGLPAVAYLVWIAAFRPGGTSVDNTRLYLTYGASTFALASALLVASAVLAPTTPLSRLLATRPLVAIGQRSYGIYLWHYPLIVAIGSDLPDLDRNAQRLLVVGATALVTMASYRFVEQPALRWKRRFERVRPGEPRRAAAPAS